MKKNNFLFFVLSSVLIILGASCSSDDDLSVSSEKQIISFKINGVSGIVNEDNKTIVVTLPYTEKVDLTKLTPVIQVSLGATLGSESEVVNFTNPVNYIVTAEDKSQVVYKVTVIKEKPSVEISKIEFEGVKVERFILHELINTIEVQVPYGTDVTALKPIITFTGKEIYPNSNEVQDFTKAIEYTIIAEDGTEVKYTLAVIFGEFTNMEVNVMNIGVIKANEPFIIEGKFLLQGNSVYVGNKKATIIRNTATELEVLAPVLPSGEYYIKVQNGVSFVIPLVLIPYENE